MFSRMPFMLSSVMVSAHLRQRRLAEFIGAIHADGERASYWAEHCAWIPGNGHCPRARRADCRDQCFFRWMRDRELAAIRRDRLRRRFRYIWSLILIGCDLAQAYCVELPITG
jgi:hypothetical protein